MRKNLALFLLISILFIGCSQEEVIKTEAQKKEKKAKFNGLRTSYFKDDPKIVLSEVEYLDGVRNGSAVDYYKNGQIRLKGAFVNGNKNGEFIWYFENGNKYKRIGYADGSLHGWDSLFFESGYHKHAVPYDKGFVQEGTKEWNRLHKEIKLPTIELRQESRVEIDGRYYLYAKFSEAVKDVMFEIGMIGNGTKEKPEQAYESMYLKSADAQEAMFFVNIRPGYEVAGKLVIKGRGKTKLGNPFVVIKSFPVVMR